MLLQHSLLHPKLSISSTVLHSNSFPWTTTNFRPRRVLNSPPLPPISCSISHAHNYGTVDYENRPTLTWNDVYRRISLMKNPELGAASVLAQCEKERKRLTSWELRRIIKELRKYKRFTQALEVYEWMVGEGDAYRLTSSDAAIQMDLVAKVHGVSAAEEYFDNVPDDVKDRRIYGALLNAYVRERNKGKAESLFREMREKNYTEHTLVFNVMMTLYMNFKEYAEVDKLVFEMSKKDIRLDMYSYNIWMSSRGSEGNIEKMEQAFEQMKLDKNVTTNWTTYSTLASFYIKVGLYDKATDCLKAIETKMTGRDRMPYHYLLSLYGNIGDKDAVFRAWNTYKSNFTKIPNLGYHAMISSLTRLGDLEAAENLYDQWMQVKTAYDPRIANLLMAGYVKEGKFDRVESVFQDIIDAGIKPNSTSWEILANGHVGEKRISQALSCLKKAVGVDTAVKIAKPNPAVVSSFFKLCEEEGDLESKEEFLGFLRELGFLGDKYYVSRIGLSDNSDKEMGKDDNGNDYGGSKDAEDSEVLLDQLNAVV